MTTTTMANDDETRMEDDLLRYTLSRLEKKKRLDGKILEETSGGWVGRERQRRDHVWGSAAMWSYPWYILFLVQFFFLFFFSVMMYCILIVAVAGGRLPSHLSCCLF